MIQPPYTLLMHPLNTSYHTSYQYRPNNATTPSSNRSLDSLYHYPLLMHPHNTPYYTPFQHTLSTHPINATPTIPSSNRLLDSLCSIISITPYPLLMHPFNAPSSHNTSSQHTLSTSPINAHASSTPLSTGQSGEVQ